MGGQRVVVHVPAQCVATAVLLLLLLLLAGTPVNASIPGPQLVFVNKFRTWIGSSERKFRPQNSTSDPIPRHGIPIDPPKLSKFAMGVDADGHLVTFGGEVESRNVPLQNIARPHNDVYLYNFGRNQWFNESIFSLVKPSARYDHAGWVWDHTLYIHGGVNDSVIGDVWAYRNRTWTEKASWRMPRLKGHSAEVLAPEGPAYIFGGIDVDGNYINSMWTVTRNGTVVQQPALGEVPTRRAYHASAKVWTRKDGWIMFIFGGSNGVQVFKDLYAYYERTKRWRLLNPGFTGQVYSFDGTLMPSVSIPQAQRHACAVRYPTLMCVGGRPVSTPIVVEYDISIDRWVRVHFTNPNRIPPLTSHRAMWFQNQNNIIELLVVGGVSGAPTRFTNPDVLHKTNFYVDPCPLGFVNPDVDGKCFKCARGTGTDPETHPRACLQCLRGTYSNWQGRCALCPIGTYNPYNASHNVSSCILCPPGYFTVAEGSWAFTQCKTCSLGTYSRNRVCTPCPPGTFGALPGQLEVDLGCRPCPFGTWSDEGRTGCEACSPGTASGPYIKRQYPYGIALRNMGESTSGNTPGGCATTGPLATVRTDRWFYVTVSTFDYGSDENQLNSIQNVRLDWWGNALRLTASFTGNPGVLYYECNNLLQVPACPFVNENVSTPSIGRGSFQQTCTGNSFFTFRLRFQRPNTPDYPQTTLSIEGQGIRPLVLQFVVLSNNYIPVWLSSEVLFAAGIRPKAPLVIQANDTAGFFDPTVVAEAPLRVQCASGTPSANPEFSVDGGVTFGQMQQVQFVEGRIVVAPIFIQGTTAAGCRFRLANSVSDLPPFSIQSATHFTFTLRSANVSNNGVMRMDLTIYDELENVVTGDSQSIFEVNLDDDARMRRWVWVRETDRRRQVIEGRAAFDITVFTYNRTGMWGRFAAHQVEGVPIPLERQVTPRFFISPANGTQIRLVNDRYPFPTVIAANSTFMVEFEVVDLFGQHDASRSFMTRMDLSDCPGASLRTLNSSQMGHLNVWMGFGRAIVPVIVVGPADAEACRIGVIGSSTSDRVRGFWSPPFSIRTPKRVAHSHCPNPYECATCPPVDAGSIMTIRVQLLSSLGHLVTHDSHHVVRFDVVGNASAAFEVDQRPEQLVTRGEATFRVFVFGDSVAPFRFRFSAGTWVLKRPLNITYATIPTFVATVQELPTETHFRAFAYIEPAVTCEIAIAAIATKIALSEETRVPTWLSNGEELRIDFSAKNDFDVLDSSYNEPWTLTIQHCHTGIMDDVSWHIVDPLTGMPAPYTGPNMPIGPFTFGRGTVTVIGTYSTDSTLAQGVSGCTILVRSGTIRPLVVSGFSIHRLYRSCLLCPPGTFSSGGTGVDQSISTFHVGGCMPCMIGTFSSDSGASTESTCQVCPRDFGYNAGVNNIAREGQTSCPLRCGTGTIGQSGGGPCPNPQQRGPTQNLGFGQYGTIGRRCPLAACIAFAQCPVGTFRLACAEYTTQGVCEHVRHNGLCTWNASQPAGEECQGPYEICVDCPPGTVQNSNNNAGGQGSCRLCDAGGWSSEIRHSQVDRTNIHRQRYRCNFGVSNWRCTGTGTGHCPNGTFSSTAGATSAETCTPCPAGHFCHQWLMYRRDTPGTAFGSPDFPCGGQMLNPMCDQGQSDFACPLAYHTTIGARAPTPCPPGTFNNRTGSSDPRDCLVCPAGTFCPTGSSKPQVTDTNNTQFDELGVARPTGVTFYGNDRPLSCYDPATDDASGYLRDGHFTAYRLHWNGGEFLGSGFENFWHGSDFRVSPITRTPPTTSGSIFMNATGNPNIFQKIELKHETASEMVARVWIYNSLESRNISIIMKHDISRWRPFAGIQLRIHRTDNYTGDETDERYYARSLNVGAPMGQWNLVEITFKPPWPIRWATFNLTTRGWYQGYALFDDASLRPSHRRICNCSTGFYFNDTEPSRKCWRCPPGFACSGGTMIRCVNSWSTTSFAGCHFCRDGWLCDSDGRGRHIPCSPLTMKNGDTETCSPCPLGYSCRDGIKRMCNAGRYGDGGYDCIVCHPGYYSPNSGLPEVECKRCSPGWFSVAGREECTKCPPNHFSPNGTACYECPHGSFAPLQEATACRSCTDLFIDNYNMTVYRNALGTAIRVVPRVCEPGFDFKAERVQHLEGAALGEVELSRATPSVLYRPGPILGVHRFRVFVTSGFRQPEQYATVDIRIDNRAPVAQDDSMSLAHPSAPITFDLTSLLFNDYDLDKDDIFFASATFGASTYGASNLQISADRKHLTVDLPAMFKGPAIVSYRIMDKPAPSIADCVAPVCKLSPTTATLTLVALQAPPIARDDRYTVLNGLVTSLDVLLNDTDPDGDEIVITSTTVATFGTRPTIRPTCPTCGGACRGIPACTCAFDAQRGKCFPSVGREYFIDYTALTTSCGLDRFDYTIETRDGRSTATVEVVSTRCFCSNPSPGIDIIFLLDGTSTVSGFAFQLSFVDALQQRSTPGASMYYGAIEVGANRVVRALGNTFIDPTAYQRHADGNRFAFAVGEGLELARAMKIDSGSPLRHTMIVVVSGRQSTDAVGAGIGSLSGLGGVFFSTISVNPTNQPWPHTQLFPSHHDATVTTFADLVGSNGAIVIDLMDRICAL